MKRVHVPFLSCASIILMAASCQVAETESPDSVRQTAGEQITITADLENDGIIEIDGEEAVPETKTVRNSDNTVWWTPGDAISLFYGEGTDGGSKFTTTLTENSAYSKFAGNIGVVSGAGEGNIELTYFWGVYPYSPTNSSGGSYVTMTIPEEQESAEGTFAPGQWPTVGKSRGLEMSFKNVGCGYKFMVETPGITSVKITAKSGFLSAKVKVSMNSSGVPVTSYAGAHTNEVSHSVIVKPQGGGSFKTGVYYYVTMLNNPDYDDGVTWTFLTDTKYATYECQFPDSKGKMEFPSGRGKFKVMDNKDHGLVWRERAKLPDGDTFRIYLKQVAGELDNITEIHFMPDMPESTLGAGIKISDDIYMEYYGGQVFVLTTGQEFVADADCSLMFWHCRKLKRIVGLEYVNTTGTTEMWSMFEGCYALQELDLSNFNTSRVTNMNNMFCDCEALRELDLSSFNTRRVTTMMFMFQWCYGLSQVYLGKDFVIRNGCDTDEMLLGVEGTFYGTTEEMESFLRNLAPYNLGGDYFPEDFHFAIDMGAAGWWSAWNIGAEKPTDFGYYFSWGNNTGHWKNVEDDGYRFTETAYSSTTGYNLNTDWQTVPYLYSNLWRVPGKSDIQKLYEKCVLLTTTVDGVKGTKFTNQSTGNSIFFPNAGYWHDYAWDPNTNYYWTRDKNLNTFYLNYNSFENSSRYYGCPIRPIATMADVSVTGISLDKTSVTMSVHDIFSLTATLSPSNASVKSVVWSSSNSSVAQVNSGGTVVCWAPGTATITATTMDGSYQASCTVKVLDAVLPGEFSVSATKKVQFSRGNLQATYYETGYLWGFAENQYDYVGNAAGNTTIDSQTSGAVVDLFGWSTSTTNYGISTSQHSADYSGDFVDWGKNFGTGKTWRTLTNAEWDYLLSNHSHKWISIRGVSGYAIAPDGVSDTSFKSSYTTDEAWKSAEDAGIVFLPSSGLRGGSIVSRAGESFYWTSTAGNHDGLAYEIYGDSDRYNYRAETGCDLGTSVRLVTDVK